MKNLARLACLPAALLAFFATASAWAGPESKFIAASDARVVEEHVPLNEVTIRNTYGFESDLNHGGSFGDQYSFQSQFEYIHRVQLNGNFYLRLGLSYERFDFGNTAAPVPVHLQSGAAIIGLDYMKGSDLGAFLWVKPGFYTEEHIGINSFDMPITVGRIFILREDQLYVLVGAQAAFLRGGYPVIPFAGLIYRPNKLWTVNAVLPAPRIIYSPTEKFDFWIGGEAAGGSFRTDRDDEITPTKLSGAQVDYEDYRAGVGFAYSPCDQVTMHFGAGYSIERGFKFHRAGENYRTDPAPYLQVGLRAKF